MVTNIFFTVLILKVFLSNQKSHDSWKKVKTSYEMITYLYLIILKNFKYILLNYIVSYRMI